MVSPSQGPTCASHKSTNINKAGSSQTDTRRDAHGLPPTPTHCSERCPLVGLKLTACMVGNFLSSCSCEELTDTHRCNYKDRTTDQGRGECPFMCLKYTFSTLGYVKDVLQATNLTMYHCSVYGLNKCPFQILVAAA